MRKPKNHIDYIVIFAFFALTALFLISACYAQVANNDQLAAPEPGTIALVSTGIVASVIRFVQRRFRDFKRIFDIVVGSLAAVAAVPVIALTAIVIKTVSPGPILYKQERVGLDGRVFDMYKLRTMRVDAEKNTGPMWAKEKDPRLIRFGGLIRKLHFDELPQLFNVLRGEMSIIGPRPERPVFVKELTKEIIDYRRRVEVKPGITGLAQVWHKYDETIADVRKKIKYDLLYIREMCLMVDLRILLRTVIVAARGKGAR